MPSSLAASGMLLLVRLTFADQLAFPILDLQRRQFPFDRLTQAEIARLDLFAGGQHHRGIHAVAQLPDVAGPGVADQLLPRGAKASGGAAMPARKVVEKIIHQQADRSAP